MKNSSVDWYGIGLFLLLGVGFLGLGWELTALFAGVVGLGLVVAEVRAGRISL